VNPLAAGPGGVNGTVVAEHHQREQGFGKRLAVRRAPRQQRRGLRVEHHDVGFAAFADLADVLVKVQGFGVAQRQPVKALPGGKRLA
jgi:hypothetical protein